MAEKTTYECFIVYKANLAEEELQKLTEKFSTLISENGTMLSIDEWGKRKLAYPIEDETEGVYYLYNFESDGEFPAELSRVLKITDGILRNLIVKKEA